MKLHGHPRRTSLLVREKLLRGWKKGLVAGSGLLAHGRGEAFDYLLGEKTHGFARKAVEAAAWELVKAGWPVISVNGNAAALAAEELVNLAKASGATLEVNLFYYSEKRARAIAKELKRFGAGKVLGLGKRMRIPEIFSDRRFVDPDGIGKADVVLLALEDGDRARALRKMGKKVIAIDLNPMSVTARSASVTIVDNIVRTLPLLLKAVKGLKKAGWRRRAEFDNHAALKEAERHMRRRL